MEGLKSLLQQPVVSTLASGAIVFGVQRLVPTTDPNWYKTILRPKWTPPNYVFPLMWIPLKTIQSIAAAMVWRQGHGKELLLPLGLFGVHLLLGNWWNVVFFSRHKMNESVKWMGLFWASIAGTAAAFAPISRPAAYMMLPTLAWVSVAWKLNVDIVRLNMGGPEAAKKNHEN
uniref:TspO/MBR-related protein n=1 Tax=Dunaliella tertiolecta TaxID=3047 RepID=A0A7S3VHW3_DUNTE|mmetsp:Transcript_28700/g.77369  ORF Transcript_28700/g.77369 Transcript_28700/m.77369 type:complete len:173 (+) Transcript_28700:69-587(+)|eukprot:CAMPEP_0202350870 /NCGR_PEP_ID=MMETSP1126-20121109/7762_1 /ASSEMBLY_ACC=CAM_ASM_000457 /TAXON_ID=3047 /ORGANISM="Dunaliella tertiolecta, Strain CCMP1320" /LENGTH=172 /DNA_ID=CAMNT_0048942913 /DNA_START=85 /DNA_END=603 /DNA_ORIENTATION=-